MPKRCLVCDAELAGLSAAQAFIAGVIIADAKSRERVDPHTFLIEKAHEAGCKFHGLSGLDAISKQALDLLRHAVDRLPPVQAQCPDCGTIETVSATQFERGVRCSATVYTVKTPRKARKCHAILIAHK